MCIFNVFAHEILPVDDAVWRWQSFIYEEFKDIFEENKQGSDGKSCAWTHFVAFEMADKLKTIAKSLADGVVLHFHEKNHISVFILKKAFQNDISQKTVRLGVL